MLVRFTINEKPISFEGNPNDNLSSVLRNLELISVKKGCMKGKCGFCTVLLNGKTISSCKIPIGMLNEKSKIETLEFIQQTEDYKYILAGFKKAEIHLCGYCNASKILFTYELLQGKFAKEDIEDFAKNISCTCTEQNSFIDGVNFALTFKKVAVDRKK